MLQATEAMTVRVSAARAGPQVVRVSLPVRPGFLGDGQTVAVRVGGEAVPASLRVLTRHPAAPAGPRFARRAMVTWLHTFRDAEPVAFEIRPVEPEAAPPAPAGVPVTVRVAGEEVHLAWGGGPVVKARLIAPGRTGDGPAEAQVVEDSAFYHWRRVRLPDPDWPRVIEVRADAAGQVVLVGHVRRDLAGNGYAPDLGWELDFRQAASRLSPPESLATAVGVSSHAFADGEPCELLFEDPLYVAYHPAAPHRRKGLARVERGGRTAYRCLRSEAGDRTPMQQAAWLRFEVVIAPEGLARLGPTLESPHEVAIDPAAWDAAYGTGAPLDPGAPELAAAVEYHREAIARCVAVGDDWGNLTSYSDDAPHGAVAGMNRLNHCPSLFEEGWRGGDRRLVEAAVLWCENFHDLSIWWGPGQTGGTRYNHGPLVDHFPPEGDPGRYMWRSNRTVHFCTKGYDAFLLAYEQTGDPRMLEALAAQVAYAGEHVRCGGECRNIGDVRDFVRLYRYTGDPHHLAQAQRLFAELTARLWPDGLFDQGGKPRCDDPPFIDDDATGERYGFAKPYIIGYALAGLPELLRAAPDTSGLRRVVQAVADFLASSQDPLGLWRYPHPRSSGVGTGLEHAWQIVQADRALGAQEAHLDAIERALRARLHPWLKTGRVLSGLLGWEQSTGHLEATGKTMADLYAHPESRDPSRDYDEGEVLTGASSPEGLVYFPEVLAFYLRHRPAERLLRPPEPHEPLGRVLARLAGAAEVGSRGVTDLLPDFYRQASGRLRFPLARAAQPNRDFASWRREARAKVMECLLASPSPRAFAPAVVAEEDRGSHVARLITFGLTGDSRVRAYFLVPKGRGPFPAVLLLHDHGARFDIGKEKVVEPLGDDPDRLASAREWVGASYGGRFIGDELARRGYACLATDMLNWSDRGGGGFEGQQALASNLLHLGMSFAGLIAHEDLRAAEFLATRPEVDPRRVAAMGLSVGGFRAWQVAALSRHVGAGVAICWMATIAGLMRPGNNQTVGQSAFTLVHPGLAAHLDLPDVASLACPKPMLFYGGLRDGLFDPNDTRRAHAKMRAVWESQGAGDALETRMWDAPHVFDAEMQEGAFEWLDAWSGRVAAAAGATE